MFMHWKTRSNWYIHLSQTIYLSNLISIKIVLSDFSFQPRWSDRHQIYFPDRNNQDNETKYMANGFDDTGHQTTNGGGPQYKWSELYHCSCLVPWGSSTWWWWGLGEWDSGRTEVRHDGIHKWHNWVSARTRSGVPARRETHRENSRHLQIASLKFCLEYWSM